MATTETVNEYVINIPGRKEPWGPEENTLFKAIVGKLPDRTKFITTRHLHTKLFSPADDTAAGTEMIRCNASEVVVNELGVDMNFRVEGNGDQNLLFCEGTGAAAANRVGIGTNSPGAKLDVFLSGDLPAISASTAAVFRNTGAGLNCQISILAGGNSDASVYFGTNLSENQGSISWNGTSLDMLFAANGNFGMGATTPRARLDVLYDSGAQLRLTHTDSAVNPDACDFTVSNTGQLRIDPYNCGLEGTVGIGIDPTSRFYVYTNSDSANINSVAYFESDNSSGDMPVIELQQDDISEGFINFIGSDRGAISGATNATESVRVEINGAVRRVALYPDA